MPCEGAGGIDCRKTEIFYKDNPIDKEKIKELILENNFLEASLCAIFTELEKEGILDRIIFRASKNGTINIMDFWDKHKRKDEVRLFDELNKFSEHEKQILKKLLNEI